MIVAAVVIPVFNEADSLPDLISEISKAVAGTGIEWRIIVVDDGSTDESASVASRLGAQVLRSDTNRGKSAALQAGFDATPDVDIVVTMDGDLQDVPAEIPKMIAKLADSDVVVGWKQTRNDSGTRKMSSRIFARLVKLLTGYEFRDINSGFKAYRRRVLDAIYLRGDYHRLIPLLAVHAGFTVSEVPVVHRPRIHGMSRYGWQRMFKGPVDLAAATFLVRFGGSPLRAFGLVGGVITALGLAITLYLTIAKLFFGQSLSDRPLLLLGVLLLVVGIQIIGAGFLGEMVAGSTRPFGQSAFRDTTAEASIRSFYRDAEASAVTLTGDQTKPGS